MAAHRVYPPGSSPRGFEIGEVCGQDLGNTFPKIDDFDFNEGVATSIKSTTQVSSRSQLVRLVAGYAGEFDTIDRDLTGLSSSGQRVTVYREAIKVRNLLMVTPPLPPGVARGLAGELAQVAETMEVNIRLVQVKGLRAQ